jgi:hypothetical protein
MRASYSAIIQNHTFQIEQDLFPQDMRSTTLELSSRCIREALQYPITGSDHTDGIRESSQVHKAEWTVTYPQL